MSTSRHVNRVHDEELVRNLLEQRAAKAGLHYRFPSLSLTEPPDTPSVYTQLSPTSIYSAGINSPIPPLLPSHIRSHDSLKYLPGPITRKSSNSSDDSTTVSQHVVASRFASSSNGEEPLLERNTSLYGPRMKFHSPAPWEVESGINSVGEQDIDTGTSDVRSIFGSRKKRHKTRDKAEKTLAGIAMGTASTHGIRRSRPSYESSNTVQTKLSNDSDRSFLASNDAALRSCTSFTSFHTSGSSSTPNGLNTHVLCVSHHLQGASTSKELPASPKQADLDNGLKTIHRTPSNPKSVPAFQGPPNSVALRRSEEKIPFPAEHLDNKVKTQSKKAPRSLPSVHPFVESFGSCTIPPQRVLLESSMQMTLSNTVQEDHLVPHIPNARTRPSNDTVPFTIISPSPAPLPRTLKSKKSGLLRIFTKEKDKDQKRGRTHVPAEVRRVDSPEFQDSKPLPLSPKQIEQADIERPPTLVPEHGPSIDNTDTALPATCIMAQMRVSLPFEPSHYHPMSAPSATTTFPTLSLRPVSSLFSDHFSHHILPSPSAASTDISSSSSSSSTSLNTPLTSPLSMPPQTTYPLVGTAGDTDQTAVLDPDHLEQMQSPRVTRRSYIWGLEQQIKDLKEEVEFLRSGEACELCGRGGSRSGVLNRPRGAPYGNRTLFGGERQR